MNRSLYILLTSVASEMGQALIKFPIKDDIYKNVFFKGISKFSKCLSNNIHVQLV